MSTLNISLPEAMKRFVETQVDSGLYSSASDYVRALIRVEQQRCAEATLAATLLHGVNQDEVDSLPPAVWAWLQTRLGSPDRAGALDTCRLSGRRLPPAASPSGGVVEPLPLRRVDHDATPASEPRG